MARRAQSSRRYPRTARLDEVVLEVLADELERLDDPRLDLVTLTGCDVARDLARATVWYTSHGDDAAAGSALATATPRLRGVLGRSVRVKQVPELVFRIDPSIATGERIDALLRGDGTRHDGLGADDPDGEEPA
jgi:ribosome-binding factor A